MTNPTAELAPLAGERLGHYCIVEKIGAGGMGDVYRARDEHLDRDVAIKVLPPQMFTDDSARKHFRKEALVLSRLNHPNVATIYDFDTQLGMDFLVMEYIPGLNLSEKMAGGPLREKDVISVGRQVAEGLAAAHERGIVHQDLKPSNLRLTTDGRLKILDFGLAKLRCPVAPNASTETCQMQTIAGTLPYMAPEQLLPGETDARTDIHALGAVLYEMATGKRPFDELAPPQLISTILHSPPPPPTTLNPSLSPEVERIISKCLEKDPEARYQSAREVAIDLRRLQTSVLRGLSSAPKRVNRSPTRRVLAWGTLAALIVLAIAFNTGKWHKQFFGRPDRVRIESLAVLPVKNFSGDSRQDFLADGMTDALIADLAQIKALKVISRTSVMHYKNTSETLPQIARELGVDRVVEASLIRSGDRVHVTAQLIDARQDRHLWASNYEREMTDVLALQSDLVRAIAGEIRVQVTPKESEQLKKTRRVDPDVYEATVKGDVILEYATREQQIRQAIELFQKAIDRDPTYAPAWAGLGDALWTLAATGFEFVAPAEVREKAVASAEKALELDENLPEAHKARADIAGDAEWDLDTAQRHYARAIELRPGYASAHNSYGQMLMIPLHRFIEARQHLDQARELNPLSPYNDINLVAWWKSQGAAERALQEGELVRRRNPALWIIPWQLGSIRLLLQQPQQAAAEFETALKLLLPERPAAVLGPLGLAYGLAGRQTDALKIVAEMEHQARARYISPFYLAMVYSGLGRMNMAFRLLDQALEQRSPSLIYCDEYDTYTPFILALRRDSRWNTFRERVRTLMRLPQVSPLRRAIQ